MSSKKLLECCHQVLPVGLVTGELGARFIHEYKEFELEFSTPDALYCRDKTCSAFIPPADIHGDNGTCKRCRRLTCRHCRLKAHPGQLWNKDKETERVKTMATKQGWQSCPKCHHMIERNQGCLHMTCKCGTDFCYNCGQTKCGGTCNRKS